MGKKMDLKSKSEMIENEIFIAVSKILLRKSPSKILPDDITIKELCSELRGSGYSKSDIIYYYNQFKELEKKKNELATREAESEKTLIVPPGLDGYITSFESHYFVSDKDPIMILGPTGVGKSMFLRMARCLFKRSYQYEKNERPIVEANCAHFSSGDGGHNMARSEIFGHVKGAYTGASQDKKGLVGKADNGLLILEEVGELPAEVQAMLLTFIETGEYRRLGDEKVRKANVKIVAATNRESALRDDFRFRFLPFYIPPLWERKEDVFYYLFNSFPELANTVSKSDVLLLLCHNWPGNVREVERVGKILFREMWLDENERDASEEKSKELNRISFKELDPVDTSFDPGALSDLNMDLIEFGVDVKFLNRLLKKKRVSLHDESPAFCFKEKVECKPLSKDNNAFYNFQIYKPHEHIEEAFEGYTLFCHFFLKNEFEDENILSTIREGNSLDNTWSIDEIWFDSAQRNEREIRSLLKSIMKFIKNYSDEKSVVKSEIYSFWQWLEEETDRIGIDNSITAKNEEFFIESMIDYTEEELLKIYYERQLKRTYGNVKAASKLVGLPENTFRSRLDKYQVDFRKKHKK
jgi:transcriptional regulator with AAA-type ATPase domain